MIRFGRLQNFLQGFARYLLKIADKWKSVTYPEYLSLTGKHPKGDLGIVELLTLQGEASWNSGSQSNEIIMTPRIVERNNASTLYGAIQDAIGPTFNIEGLHKLSKHQEVIIFSQVPDAAKYVKRFRKFFSKQLPTNCLSLDISCVIHRLCRIFTLAVREDALCGHGHAINFISTHPSKKKQIQEAAHAIEDEELLVIFTEPPPEVTQQTQRILDHTVLRREGMIRGRIIDGACAFPGKHRAQRGKERCDKLKSVGNGDWSIHRCIHHERGCCTDEHGQSSLELFALRTSSLQLSMAVL